LSNEAATAKDRILQNLLAAAKQANIKHMVVVDEGTILPQLDKLGLPYTCIRASQLIDTPNYSFKDGVCGDLLISSMDDFSMDNSRKDVAPVCREDLAALCVQSLQSLSWEKSRCLSVSCNGPVEIQVGRQREQQVHQQWCVNSFILEDKMAAIA
jgi:hypothetical protein